MTPSTLDAADVLAFVLVLLRVLPLGLALSTLSRELVPHAVALSLSLALAAALVPVVGPLPLPPRPGALLVALLRELCIGASFALALSLVFSAIGWTVRLGQGHAGVVSEPFARAYVLCAAWLVLSLGGLRALVIGLAESFVDAAPGQTRLDARAFALGTAQLLVDALATAVGFALPLLISVWLLELAATLVVRVVAPTTLVHAPSLRPLWFFFVAALLLAPIVSSAPEAVRGAIGAARALTRALAR
jgi:flagellar biosynthesis protein FliR